MINLTPHGINVNGTIYEPSGVVARVIMEEKIVNTLNGITVISRFATGVEGIPEEGEFLVSSMVLDALDDVYHMHAFAPDTGASAVRNEKGHIVMVTRLVTK